MERKKTALAEDVKRLLKAISKDLTPEETAKIDQSALAAVRAHFAEPPPKQRSIDPSYLRGWTVSAPFDMAELEARVNKICGCTGQYDCDCVSVFNKASTELWTEHNGRSRSAAA